MGNNSLRNIEQGLSSPDEQGFVTAGRILGMIGTALSLIPCGIALLVQGGMMTVPFLAR